PSLRRWLDSSTVVPFCRNSSMASRKAASMSGSRPDVGSSRMSSSAPDASAAISATFCRLALEEARVLGVGARAHRFSSRSRAVVFRAPPTRAGRSVASAPDTCRRAAAAPGPDARPGITAEEARGTGVGVQQAEEDPQGRRLAGAVWPQEAVYLTVGHGQVEPIQRARLAKVLDQAGHFDCRSHGSYHTLNSENHESSERTLPLAAGRTGPARRSGPGGRGGSGGAATGRAGRKSPAGPR